jgi:hypothetical protein
MALAPHGVGQAGHPRFAPLGERGIGCGRGHLFLPQVHEIAGKLRQIRFVAHAAQYRKGGVPPTPLCYGTATSPVRSAAIAP